MLNRVEKYKKNDSTNNTSTNFGVFLNKLPDLFDFSNIKLSRAVAEHFNFLIFFDVTLHGAGIVNFVVDADFSGRTQNGGCTACLSHQGTGVTVHSDVAFVVVLRSMEGQASKDAAFGTHQFVAEIDGQEDASAETAQHNQQGFQKLAIANAAEIEDDIVEQTQGESGYRHYNA